jgi:hypothetical protein
MTKRGKEDRPFRSRPFFSGLTRQGMLPFANKAPTFFSLGLLEGEGSVTKMCFFFVPWCVSCGAVNLLPPQFVHEGWHTPRSLLGEGGPDFDLIFIFQNQKTKPFLSLVSLKQKKKNKGRGTGAIPIALTT